MILALDVGNTNIKTAVFDGNTIRYYWRLSTNITATSDEIGVALVGLFRYADLPLSAIDGIILSSVVPSINFTLEHMCDTYFRMSPMVVSHSMNTGITFDIDHPRELGSDRIANAVATFAEYGGPSIFIDFGTATTFGVVNEQGAFLGGAICPGLKLSAEALVSGTAKLPRVEIKKPNAVIAKNTITNMQSGLFYGNVGLVNNIVARMKEEIGAPHAKVVATGGLSRLIATDTRAIDVLDGLLTLKGLKILYERNR